MEHQRLGTDALAFIGEASAQKEASAEASSIIFPEPFANANLVLQVTQHFLPIYQSVAIGVAISLEHQLYLYSWASGVDGGKIATNQLIFTQLATNNGPNNRTPLQPIQIQQFANINIEKQISGDNAVNILSEAYFILNRIANFTDVYFVNSFGERNFNSHYSNVGFTRGFSRYEALEYAVILVHTDNPNGYWEFLRKNNIYDASGFTFGTPALEAIFNSGDWLPLDDYESYQNNGYSMRYDTGLTQWVIVDVSGNIWFWATPTGAKVPDLGTTWMHNPATTPLGTGDAGKTERQVLYYSDIQNDVPTTDLAWHFGNIGISPIGRLDIL